jgi:hypothetical protein
MRLLTGLILAAGVMLAGVLPKNNVRGVYVEARNGDVYTGACYANAEVNLMGELALMGWVIEKGSFNGVALDGLGVAGVIKAGATLGDVHSKNYPVKASLVVDERATPAQRQALLAFAKHMAGDLFADVTNIETQPISLDVKNNNIHLASVKFTAGKVVNIETRSMAEGDKICRHEEVWYAPLTKVDHAMPAYSLTAKFDGDGLGTKFNAAEKRGAFVATFHLEE